MLHEQLMFRFFEGETTREEEEKLFQWLKEDITHIQKFLEERKNYDVDLISNDRLTVPVNIGREYEKIQKFIENDKKVQLEKHRSKKRLVWIKYIKRAVSYAAVFACIVLLGKEFLPKNNRQEGLASGDRKVAVSLQAQSHVAVVPRECKEVQVIKGSKREFRLPDNTRVWLNSQSTLKFPGKFNGNTREVWLEGEAYFEVSKNKEKQFIVHTREFDVKVYGTSFNVFAYNEYSEKSFTLVEGSIKLTSNLDTGSGGLYLTPGQQATYNEGELNIKDIDPVTEVSWKDNKFYFREKPFREICRQLEHSFNVTIQIEGENLKNSVYTGDFIRNESLMEILNIMSADSRMDYRINGNTIIIGEK